MRNRDAGFCTVFGCVCALAHVFSFRFADEACQESAGFSSRL